jgi:hypothetical protein
MSKNHLATRPSVPQQSAPPAPAAAPVVAGAQDPLVAQNQVLTEQLAGLQAQRQVLLTQSASGQTAIRQAAFDRLPGVETQIAQVSVDLASVRARIASRSSSQGGRESIEGQATRHSTYSPGGAKSDIPPLMMSAFIVGLSVPFMWRWVRRGRRPRAGLEQPSLSMVDLPRFERLEQAVDAIAIEVERISEGQRFVTRVLTERPAGSEDPQGFRALGAGPIEPVRVAERQAVRQSVTPH